jgi:hypothetical protein|tara:strand:- start:10754 stop:11020 length:267 start_codon:yes stop_codon:yes gene_type:complete
MPPIEYTEFCNVIGMFNLSAGQYLKEVWSTTEADDVIGLQKDILTAINYESYEPAEALASLFIWRDSPQGYSFWSAIFTKLSDIKEIV